jgi:molybdopterin adenylyltransferase
MLCGVGILTISDSRATGGNADTTTALIRQLLVSLGYHVTHTALIPDDASKIESELADDYRTSVVLTTGGTGFGPRDVTPEATRAVIDRDVPGIPEAMRAITAQHNAHAWLSRAVAGLRGTTLIINLPGSPRAVEECLDVVLPFLPHAISMAVGKQAQHA